MSLDWIESNGGPLILLENRLLPHWEGTDPPSGGRVVKATFRWQGKDPATDYDRACDVRDRLGIVPVGDGHGLVLNDEPLPTALWRPDSSDAVVLVRWEYADNEADVLRHLDDLAQAPWRTWEEGLTLRQEDPLLFDSAYPGAQAPDARIVPLAASRYRMDIAHWRPDDLTALVLIRFSLQS